MAAIAILELVLHARLFVVASTHHFIFTIIAISH